MPNYNPNTSGLRPFKKGQSGNPAGKTSEQKRKEMENARLATELTRAYLTKLEATMDAHEACGEDFTHLFDRPTLCLIEHAQTRAFGKALKAKMPTGV